MRIKVNRPRAETLLCPTKTCPESLHPSVCKGKGLSVDDPKLGISGKFHAERNSGSSFDTGALRFSSLDTL